MTSDKMATPLNTHGLPLIPVNLREHKLPIGLYWGSIILTSGLLPIAGFFALFYGAHLPLNICLSPWLGLMGVTSIYSLGMRTWNLVKKNSTCRPLGVESRAAMDFFGWNFLVDFIALTVFISLGIALGSLVVVSLPLSVLMILVCAELLIVQVLMSMGVRAPFRFSSVARGEALRPGSYIIAEDVVAVDGKQGQEFRKAWNDRYEASAAFRSHLRRVDVLWGTTGLSVAAVVWGCALGIADHRVGFVIGWVLPWLWAGLMTVVTIRMSKGMLRREGEMAHRSTFA